MAKGANQKLKLLYLLKIFMEETDEQHPLDLLAVTERLNACGVNADRKTLYLDFEELRHFGFDIIGAQQGRNYGYYLGSRDFELPELKLLVDAVQSSRFITDRKSKELIHKLEKLVSRYDADRLNRQVFIPGRIKTMNESIYYNIDTIHEAIAGDRQISFQYFQWNLKKEPELRHGGALYQVSPWSLLWDNENYYLVAYDQKDRRIKHYRVDKMLRISASDLPRDGQEAFRSFDLPRYTKSLFGMYGGKETRITLEAENDLIGILIDRFGKDIPVIPVDDKHFRTMLNVSVSPQFFGWIMALSDKIRITAPEEVILELQETIQKISSLYR